MKPFSLVAITLIALYFSGCSRSFISMSRHSMDEDEKHRLYSAALAASDSPQDTDTFKKVCREIGIVDARGQANDQYMAFMSAHVNWGMTAETEPFRQEINSKEKAQDYLKRHLSAAE
jgi:hypothetical protein